jgi:aspartate 1-decarboxylase
MAKRCFLSAKLHQATITEANVNYQGSLAICPHLMAASGILPHEQVDVYNLENGERLTTYAIKGEPKEICLNGAAALKGRPGQKVIIATYTWLDEQEISGYEPKVVLVGAANEPLVS